MALELDEAAQASIAALKQGTQASKELSEERIAFAALQAKL